MTTACPPSVGTASRARFAFGGATLPRARDDGPRFEAHASRCRCRSRDSSRMVVVPVTVSNGTSPSLAPKEGGQAGLAARGTSSGVLSNAATLQRSQPCYMCLFEQPKCFTRWGSNAMTSSPCGHCGSPTTKCDEYEACDVCGWQPPPPAPVERWAQADRGDAPSRVACIRRTETRSSDSPRS